MTAPTPEPTVLTKEELAGLLHELSDWESDGFVSRAANNVTKVWAARAKRCAGVFRNLIATIEAAERRVAELEKALEAFLTLRDWMLQAGGANGPLPNDVIEKFAAMQAVAVDGARKALTSREGDKT